MKSARDVIAEVYHMDSPGVGTRLSLEAADMYLEALNAAGYVVAPREPTEVMTRRGEHAGLKYVCDVNADATLREARPTVVTEIYRAMLAAMPDAVPQQAPAAGVVSGRLEWRGRGTTLYLGEISVGCISRNALTESRHWQALCTAAGHTDSRGYFLDELEARAAVERAVRDAIGAPQRPTHAPNAIRTTGC